jgi:hypothetical protein
MTTGRRPPLAARWKWPGSPEKVTQRPGVGTLNWRSMAQPRNALAVRQSGSQHRQEGRRIQIRKGRTSGQSIGLTAQAVDLGKDTARWLGFALNNLLSNVPLLGPLLTGGKDGGVFAISYQLDGPLDDLKTDINMMSAVTPGALRELFNGPADGYQPPASQEMQRAP